MTTRLHARRRFGIVASGIALVLVASACGGSSGNKSGDKKGPSTTQGATVATNEGKPKTGGSVVWSLPAETSGGFCQPEAQLAISGIQENRALYDTLTVPDENGDYQPYLAESITSNDTKTEWTIKLRDGVKFHDGTDLTAEVVKNNLDAYRGVYAKTDSTGKKLRNPLLFLFVFSDVTATKVVDNLTVQVTTKPWSAFPAHLYSSGRMGIMAQAQLDDATSCLTKMIGTGPFKLKEWKRDDHMTVVKNPDYWRKDADGVQLPYLDEIEFRPVVTSSQVQNGIKSGNLDIALDDSSTNTVEYRKLADAGTIKLAQSDVFPELSYNLMNVTKPPFDNINARLAFAYAVDRAKLNQVRNHGILTPASGPFGPGVMGFLADTGLPKYNPTTAKSYMAKYKADTGQDLAFTYLSAGTDPEGLATIDFINIYMKAVGIKMTVKAVDESQGINSVIGKDYQMVGWRNHPGYDPDTEYVWWHCSNVGKPNECGNPVNFNGFNDPVINKAFDTARASTDPAERKSQYEIINKEFAKQLFNAWGFYSLWTIPHADKVSGVGTLPIPGGNKPFPGFTSGVDPAGVWTN